MRCLPKLIAAVPWLSLILLAELRADDRSQGRELNREDACGAAALLEKLPVEGDDQAQSVTPSEQFKALVKEVNEATQGFWQTTTDDERKNVASRLAKIAPRVLELAEKNAQGPIAVDALIQVITLELFLENNTTHPGFGKDSLEARAITILLRDHIRSEKLGEACRRVHYGFRRECETLQRTVLEKSPHREVRAMACLQLAQFLELRRLRLDLLKEQPEMAQRYEGLFGKDYLKVLHQQDEAQVVKETESLFEQAIEKYGDVKVPYAGTVAETAESEFV